MVTLTPRYEFAEYFNKDLHNKTTYLEVDTQFFPHIHQGNNKLALWCLDVDKCEQESFEMFEYVNKFFS